MLLLHHALVSEWIFTLSLPECQGTSCSKQTPYLNLSDNNGIQTQNHLVCKWTLNHFAKLAKLPVWLNGWVCVYKLNGCGFDIDDQRIWQSDWTNGTTGHTQAKKVVSRAIFP